MGKLSSILTVENPEYASQVRFRSPYSREPLPEEYLTFLRELPNGKYEVPRNIPLELVSDRCMMDFTFQGEKMSPGVQFTGYLRDYQEDFYQEIENDGKTDVVMCMPCGHGKTVVGLYHVARIGVCTLVIVPSKYLGEQWLQDVKEFLPDAEVSFCSSAQFIKKSLKEDILIITIDMLCNNIMFFNELAKFGHVVMDECHTMGAKTYHPVISKLPARHRTALTATFRRMDGMHNILKYHFGKVYTMKPQFPPAKLVPVKTSISPESLKHISHGDNISFSKMDSFLANSPERREMVVDMITEFVAMGRNIIVLSKRREFLEALHDHFREAGVKSALVVGGATKDKQLLKYVRDEAQVVFGIMQLAKEGLDVPRLDTLIFTHPVKDVEQPIGRILRVVQGKPQPVAIYLVDDIRPCMKIFEASRKYCTNADVTPVVGYDDLIRRMRKNTRSSSK